jgi:predicted Zn-dependent protease
MRWEKQLLSTEPKRTPAQAPARQARAKVPQFGDEADLTRRIRLGDLLFSRGHVAAAVRELEPVVEAARDEPAVCWRAARALLAAERPEDARRRLGRLNDMKSPHGPWLGLSGRFARETGDQPGATQAFALGRALDPLAEEVACEGHFGLPGPGRPQAQLPTGPAERALCEAARKVSTGRFLSRE